jgi:hypothetical protein
MARLEFAITKLVGYLLKHQKKRGRDTQGYKADTRRLGHVQRRVTAGEGYDLHITAPP